MVKIFRTSVSVGRININGKTYSSVDEMPPDVRKQYEQTMQNLMADKDHDGIPDLLEHPSASTGKVGVSTAQSITVNGQHYDRVEDVPAEFRDAIAKAMSKAQVEMTNAQMSTNKVPLRLLASQAGSSSIAKWIILVAALLTAGAIGWLLHAH
jgi:hypothetical protein